MYLPDVRFSDLAAQIKGGCVVMVAGQAMGLWEVKDCANVRSKYICKQNQDSSFNPSPPVPQPTPSLTGSCPSGWKSTNAFRHCYKVFYYSYICFLVFGCVLTSCLCSRRSFTQVLWRKGWLGFKLTSSARNMDLSSPASAHRKRRPSSFRFSMRLLGTCVCVWDKGTILKCTLRATLCVFVWVCKIECY